MPPSSFLDAMPVYPFWVRVNPTSQHKAMFPPATVPVDKHPHCEVSTARGVLPPFQKFSKTVRCDGHVVALDGHNNGPLAGHICMPPNNSMLAVTAISSKCKWVFTAHRRTAGGKSMAAFQHLFAPYLFCDDGDKDSKDEKGEGVEAKQFPVAPGVQAPKPTPVPSASSSSSSSRKGAGIGLFMIPTGPNTVTLKLGFMDYAVGVAKQLANKAFDKAFNTVWKRLSLDPKVCVSPLQSSAACCSHSDAIARLLAETALKKAAKGYVKGVYKSASVGLPFKLAKLDLRTGDITVWTRDAGNIGWGLSEATGLPARGFKGVVQDVVQAIDQLGAEPGPTTDATDVFVEGAPHAG